MNRIYHFALMLFATLIFNIAIEGFDKTDEPLQEFTCTDASSSVIKRHQATSSDIKRHQGYI
jgi:hypothetical protein